MKLLFPFHVIAACLAVWRITDLFTQDRITVKLRAKINSYLLTCPRCFSVWAAGWCTAILACSQFYGWAHNLVWLNWPFALAWVYLWHLESVTAKRVTEKGRQFAVEVKDGKFTVSRVELNQQEIQTIVNQLYAPQQTQAASGD